MDFEPVRPGGEATLGTLMVLPRPGNGEATGVAPFDRYLRGLEPTEEATSSCWCPKSADDGAPLRPSQWSQIRARDGAPRCAVMVPPTRWGAELGRYPRGPFDQYLRALSPTSCAVANVALCVRGESMSEEVVRGAVRSRPGSLDLMRLSASVAILCVR